MKKVFLIALLSVYQQAAFAEQYSVNQCIDWASNHYSVPVYLINAIIRVESNFNPQATNYNKKSRSEDIGLMQINSQWLPKIKALGYTRESLFQPCTNVAVGTWILSQEIKRFGYSWDAIMAYNVGPVFKPSNQKKRYQYAKRVARYITQ